MKSNTESLAWENLRYDLHPWIKEAISSMGYPTMTPVQASTIPLLSGNKDVVVGSSHWIRKTLSFVIPVLQKSLIDYIKPDSDGDLPEPVKRGHMLSIVLSPTRELANQIQKCFQSSITIFT